MPSKILQHISSDGISFAPDGIYVASQHWPRLGWHLMKLAHDVELFSIGRIPAIGNLTTGGIIGLTTSGSALCAALAEGGITKNAATDFDPELITSGAFGRFCGRGFAQRSARCSGKGRRNCPGGKKRVSLRPLISAGGVFRQKAVRSHHARTGSCRGSDASVSDDAGEGASPKRSVAGSLCGWLRFF